MVEPNNSLEWLIRAKSNLNRAKDSKDLEQIK